MWPLVMLKLQNGHLLSICAELKKDTPFGIQQIAISTNKLAKEKPKGASIDCPTNA